MRLQALKNLLKVERGNESAAAAKIKKLAASADAINKSGHVRRL